MVEPQPDRCYGWTVWELIMIRAATNTKRDSQGVFLFPGMREEPDWRPAPKIQNPFTPPPIERAEEEDDEKSLHHLRP